MEGIRIVSLPKTKAVSSGYQAGQDLDKWIAAFSGWFSEIETKRRDRFFPRDFMSYDGDQKSLIWFYAIPEEMEQTNGYEVVDFEGGLYAAAISKDKDDADGARVYNAVKKWVVDSGVFELDERHNHYTLFHVITPDEVFEVMGYRQLDIYVPIKVR